MWLGIYSERSLVWTTKSVSHTEKKIIIIIHEKWLIEFAAYIHHSITHTYKLCHILRTASHWEDCRNSTDSESMTQTACVYLTIIISVFLSLLFHCRPFKNGPWTLAQFTMTCKTATRQKAREKNHLQFIYIYHTFIQIAGSHDFFMNLWRIFYRRTIYRQTSVREACDVFLLWFKYVYT